MRHLRSIKAADFDALAGESDYERAAREDALVVARYATSKVEYVLVDAPNATSLPGSPVSEDDLPKAAREALAAHRESVSWL